MLNPTTFSDPLESINSFLAAVDYLRDSSVNVVPPYVELITNTRYPEDILRFLERTTRTADKSELAVGPASHKEILAQVVSKNPELELEHESGLDHVSFTFRIQASQGVTQEIARQHSAFHTQASPRYISYANHPEATSRNLSHSDRPTEVVFPWHLLAYNNPEMVQFWQKGVESEYALYLEAVDRFHWKAEEARGFLPNDALTEIVTTMNIRQWRNFLRVRTAPDAHPDVQVIAREMLRILMLKFPVLFQDIQDQVDARIEGKGYWIERSEGEIEARLPSTYHQWHEVMPPAPRPGTGLPVYAGWTRPSEKDLRRDPSKDYWVPYVKPSPELEDEWAFKHLAKLVDDPIALTKR